MLALNNVVPDAHISDASPISNPDVVTDIPQCVHHQTPSQGQDIKDNLYIHSSLFRDDPGLYNIASHDVPPVPATSLKSYNSYRIHSQQPKQMQTEAQHLLDQRLAIPSQSPWASPCLLVSKEDGQVPPCPDYCRVSSVTIPDTDPLPRWMIRSMR